MLTISVQIEIAYNIAEIAHILGATGASAAGRVGRTHISGELAHDIRNSHLKADHLLNALFAGDLVEILMRPGVGGNLMALSNHTLQHSGPGLGLVVNGAFVDVDTGDKESGLEAVGGELVQDVVGVDVGTVIVGDGDGARFNTVVDALATVGNGTQLGAGDFPRGSSGWKLVSITAGAVLKLTVRRHAILVADATPSLLNC